MLLQNSFWFKDCKHHIIVDVLHTDSTMTFNFTSQRIVDKGLILIVKTKKEDKNHSLSYDLTHDNMLLQSESGKQVKTRNLLQTVINLVNETF